MAAEVRLHDKNAPGKSIGICEEFSYVCLLTNIQYKKIINASWGELIDICVHLKCTFFGSVFETQMLICTLYHATPTISQWLVSMINNVNICISMSI
jgi:hypothetical protein